MRTASTTRRTERRRVRRGVRAALGGVAVLASLLVPAAAAPALGGPVRDTGTSKQSYEHINYAVAVDESASIGRDAMRAERAAAKRIALGDTSARSTVAVFGFAAAERAGQSAVDPVCPTTTLDTAGRESIGACIGKLHSRTEAEGTGTDFPSAVSQAVDALGNGTDPAVPRVLFLLTDGRLDVSDVPSYGDPAHRQAEGERRLTQELAAARALNVQVWPLGFGRDPDKPALDAMAAQGYQQGCVDVPDAQPAAHKVSGPSQVAAVLEQDFAAAHCLRYQPGSPPHTPPATLAVRISPLATVGTIVVDKGDAAVTVTYTDPQGNTVPADGSMEGSRFELAGAGDTVEALKITDPVPGMWHVHAKAPSGHRSLPVAVNVLWHGELRGSLTMDPPSPRAGQQVTVTMRLQTRDGYRIKDPADYAGLHVDGELSGDGFTALPLRLADDGAVPGTTARDGAFTAKVTVPSSATGALKVAGTLAVVGLTADTRDLTGRIAPARPPVTAALTLPSGTVHPGGTVTGTLAVHNSGGTPHILQLSVTDVRPGLLSAGPARITVRPGTDTTEKVRLRVGPRGAFDGRLGDGVRLGGTATVTDATDHDRPLAQAQVSVRVTPAPTFWDTWWWAFVTAGALLVLAALGAVAWLRARGRRYDPKGLPLQLTDDHGDPVGRIHPAGHGQGGWFGQGGWYGFAIVDPDSHPRIERRPGGPYAVRRNPEGGAFVRGQGGRQAVLKPGGRYELTHGLGLTLGAAAGPGPGRKLDGQGLGTFL